MSDFGVDVQPTGERIEQTLDVVPKILFDVDFAREVADHNGFPEDISQEMIAILFLTGRFHWAVATLTQRTDTLCREIDGILREDAEDEYDG